MKKSIAFLLAAVILSVLSNAAFCEGGVTTLNASGTLNRAVSVDPTGRSEGFSAVIYNNLNGLPDVVDAFLRLVDRGEFRDPDDNGGGSLENIENIHSVLDNQSRASGPLKL